MFQCAACGTRRAPQAAYRNIGDPTKANMFSQFGEHVFPVWQNNMNIRVVISFSTFFNEFLRGLV